MDYFSATSPVLARGAEQQAKVVVTPTTSEEVAANARWAEMAFGDGVASTQATNRLTLVHEDVAGDTKIGRCGFGTPLRLGDKTYTRGIGVNSRSVLRVSTAQGAARFVADIGLDRNVDHTAASVTMHVSVDGKDLFQTPVLRPDGKMQTIDVAIGGANSFDLVVNDGGDGRGWDQADWADARVILQDGTVLWLDDLANQASPGTRRAILVRLRWTTLDRNLAAVATTDIRPADRRHSHAADPDADRSGDRSRGPR